MACVLRVMMDPPSQWRRVVGIEENVGVQRVLSSGCGRKEADFESVDLRVAKFGTILVGRGGLAGAE